MNKNYYAIIMAGGIGSRFWPMSTTEFPKQFHDVLGNGKSLIQTTYKRLSNVISNENILTSTNNRYKDLVLDQLPNLSQNDLILEPCKRSTAPAILYAAFKIHFQNPDAVMVIAPSDHWIKNEKLFNDSVLTALEYCENNDVLMTLGIRPDAPNTEYGYIQYNNDETPIKQVRQFIEKPNLEKAEEYVESGDYLWNAGIFIWSTKSILKAFKKQLPEMYELFERGSKLYNTSKESASIEKIYSKVENISIDYGVLENATNIHVLPVDFGWNDLGTWGSLYSKLPKDDSNNAVVGGDAIFKDAANNMVRTQKHKKVVIQGLDNYIVVEKNDVLLIYPKSHEKDITKITAKVKDKFGDNFV